MRCPNCRKDVSYEGNPYRPFCSARCKLIDLDNWLSGHYRISTPVTAEEKSEPTLTGPVPETEVDAKAKRD